MELFHQIKSDPLRTFLSLFGVSVGIFVVVVSFALVDAFKQAVVAGFDHFGSEMIMVERFPVVEDGQGVEEAASEGGGKRLDGDEDDWSRYAMRPQPSREDYHAIMAGGQNVYNQQIMQSNPSLSEGGYFPQAAGTQTINRQQAIAEHVRDSHKIASAERRGLGQRPSIIGWTAFAGQAEADIVYDNLALYKCKLVGVCGAWQHLVYSSVCEGRDFSLAESSGGDAKVILGAKVAEQLFGKPSSQIASEKDAPCGKTVRIDGRNMTVIGVLSPEGKNVINLYATDYALIVPFATAQRIAGKNALETMIAVGPGAAGRDATMEDIRRQLRAARHLSPAQEDNFALNTMEDLCRQTVDLTSKITGVGMLVAVFSLLIGGFGIVNIMLVSVKERTWYIGLEKALGARRRRILLEFLLEALLLSLLGAAIGLLFAWGVVSIIPDGVVAARLSPKHIVLAFALAAVLGLASGLAPAAQASRLNPVEALRK